MVGEVTRDLSGDRRLLVFGCEGKFRPEKHTDSQTAAVSLICMAQLPPSFIDWILSRDLADGVVLAGCAHNDCQYRLGAKWTEQRINRVRDPRLRNRVDTERLALLWTEPWSDFPKMASAIDAFRDTLATEDRTSGEVQTGRHYFRPVGVAIAWGLFALASVIFTVWPRFSQLDDGNAIISLTFSHAGQRVEECRKLTQEELNKLPPNMRKPTDCPRQRHPVDVLFSVDDQVLYQQSLSPSGVWRDGESVAYYRFEIPAGSHELFIGMNDSGRKDGFDYSGQTEFTLGEGQHAVVEFDHLNKTFIFR
jgi:coenzyme F420-reducing hydrogenase delta subunit